MSNYFFHVHLEECRPVCVLDGLNTYIEWTPRPLLLDSPASVERLDGAIASAIVDTAWEWWLAGRPEEFRVNAYISLRDAIIAALVAEQPAAQRPDRRGEGS